MLVVFKEKNIGWRSILADMQGLITDIREETRYYATSD